MRIEKESSQEYRKNRREEKRCKIGNTRFGLKGVKRRVAWTGYRYTRRVELLNREFQRILAHAARLTTNDGDK